MSHHELSLSGDEKGFDGRTDTLTLSNSNLNSNSNLDLSSGVPAYDDVGSIHSESSMIFERNVEDPYSQVFSNPRLASLSRSGSHANLGLESPQDGLPSSNGYSVPLSRKQSNAGSFVSHHTLENLVAPALDEGVTIVNDDSTDLETVEMIYSRRPSTIGLDMALGRTRTCSFSETATLNASASNSNTNLGSCPNPRLMRTNSASQGSGPGSAEARPRVLRFYSYADMLSDENSSNPRRPSITQSLSSTLLRQQQQQQQQPGGPGLPHDPYQPTSPSFSNPFLNSQSSGSGPGNGVQSPTSPLDAQRKHSNVSIPPLSVTTRHFSNNMLSRSPNTTAPAAHRLSSSPLMIPHNTNSALLRKSHFQIESSGSECSDEETDRDQHRRSNSNNSNASNCSNTIAKAKTIPNSSNINSPNYTQYRHSDRDLTSAGTLNTSPPNQQQGLRLSRTSTQGSGFGKKLSPPAYKARAYSNASSNSPYNNNLSRSSFSSANTQRLDDVLFDEQLQSNTVSEVLKKKLTNDI